MQRGDVCARAGHPVTANPYQPNTAAYFQWHADWHDFLARCPKTPQQRQDRSKFEKLATMYRRQASAAALTDTHGEAGR
ncbi:hypothetical protein D3874_03150 [Oleomonas cavernae]|uniref:Uncharacterized protein n=2 Tax=Oleomonas cavernae TaxID=2320859 RepID=A0A418WUB3_9PROT|nr:hypothetical protein D3874_03150 [Oleomonas cavernae]